MPLTFPLTVSHQDPSGLFTLEATIVAWRKGETADDGSITLILGSGTLHDADKGPFDLDGLELSVGIEDGQLEPVGVRNPGVLSEFQQEALLDALASAMNALNRRWSSFSESELP